MRTARSNEDKTIRDIFDEQTRTVGWMIAGFTLLMIEIIGFMVLIRR